MACPKDLTMDRAAVSATGNQDRLAEWDIADPVVHAVGLEPADTEAEVGA